MLGGEEAISHRANSSLYSSISVDIFDDKRINFFMQNRFDFTKK